MHRPKLQKLASVESMKSTSEEDSASEDSMVMEEKEPPEIKPTTWQILQLCAPEKWLMIVGVFAAVAVGSSFPAFAVLFGETYGVSITLRLLKWLRPKGQAWNRYTSLERPWSCVSVVPYPGGMFF